MERLVTAAQMERASQVARELSGSLFMALPDRAGGLYLSTAKTQARVAELARILGTDGEESRPMTYDEICKREG